MEICRICLDVHNFDQLIELFDNNGHIFLKTIIKLTQLQISSEGGLPTKICKPCGDKLEEFVKFRNQIENHEYLLKKCLAKSVSETEENIKKLSDNINGRQIFIKSPERSLIDDHLNINSLTLPLTDSVTINTLADEQNLDILEKEVTKLINFEPDIEELPILEFRKNMVINPCSILREPQDPGYEDITQYLKTSLDADFYKLKEDVQNIKHSQRTTNPEKAIAKLTSRGVTLVKVENNTVEDKVEEVVKRSDFVTTLEMREIFVDEDVLEEVAPRICESTITLLQVDDSDTTNREEFFTFNRHICHLCLKEFKEFDKEEFIKHSAGHFPTNADIKVQNCPPFVCEVCKKTFLHRIDFVMHQREHFNLKLFPCDSCVKCFISISHLKVHKAVCSKRDPPATFTCVHCGLNFSKRKDLNNHEKSHESRKLKCELCEKTFTNPATLKSHIKRHTIGFTFKCDRCTKSFFKRHDLERHFQGHTGIKKFPCNVCDKSFCTNAERRRHMLYHSKTKRFACTVCGKKFYEVGHLQAHRNTHLENKPFMCEVCSKDFTTKAKLNRHMKTHGEKSTQDLQILSEDVEMMADDLDGFIIVEESGDEDDEGEDGQMFTDEAGKMFILKDSLSLPPIE